jgi:hypothetical protein
MAAAAPATPYAPAPLKFYTPRRPIPAGQTHRNWLAFEPPVTPSSVEIDSAVREMKSKFDITKVDRVDDPTKPPESIESYHVTICAAVNEPEKNVPLIRDAVEKMQFTADELTPVLDEKTRVHVSRTFDKNGTVFTIFEYKQSERLRALRAELTAKYCDTTKYPGHEPHVTAVYGTLAKKDVVKSPPAAAAAVAAGTPAAAAAAASAAPVAMTDK